jgi:putative membrane protein
VKCNDILLNFFRGIMIGIADLFPGISGGTIALIMGVYERLMKVLSSFNRPLLVSIFRPGKERVERIRNIDLVFLVPLLAGIGSALFIGARGTSYLIENHPVLIMSFFFGFIVLSLRLPWRMVKKKDARSYASLIIGILAAVSISLYSDGSLPSGPAFMAASGFVAASFMLLPGVSGSSALVLLGTYAEIIGAVGVFDFAILLPFVLGAGLGVIFITRLLNKMLRNHHDVTMAALTGLLAGSMVRVWPVRSETGFAEGMPIVGMEIFSIEVIAGIASGLAIMILSERIAKVIEGKKAFSTAHDSDLHE